MRIRRALQKNKPAVVLCLLLTAATAAVYLPMLTNGFVGLDDDVYITANPLIASFSAANLKAILTRPYAEFYHPVTLLSLALDHALWGLKPFGYHLTDLLLHLLNTVLVFWIAYRLVLAGKGAGEGTESRDFARLAALVTAGLFGLHPLHVESVAWAAQRKDLLCTFFYLGAFLFYIEHAESAWKRSSRLAYRLSLGAFVLALLSKSMAVTLPAALVIVDIYPFRRLRTWPLRGRLPEDERGVWLEKLPFFGLAAAATVATISAQSQGGALRSASEIPWSLRPWLVLHSYGFYLWKAVAPENLTVLYPIPKVGPAVAVVWLSLGVLFCLAAVSWLLRKRTPAFAAAWAYYAITLAPVCGLLSFGAQSVADRYSYLPLLGPFLLAGLAIARIDALGDRGVRPTIRAVVGVAAGLLLVLLSALTSRQVAYWHNGESLWKHLLAIYPNNPRGRFNLGFFYHSHGQTDRAIREYERCLEIRPRFFDAHINLGSLLLGRGDIRGAIEHFRQAGAIRPEHAGAHYNLGLALLRADKIEEAIGELKRALSLDPDFARAHAALGRALAQKGAVGPAIRQYRAALRLDPRLAQAHEDLAFAYLAIGRTAEARLEFKRTLHLRPRSPDSLIQLGRLDGASSHPLRALHYLSKAAHFRPRDPEIHLEMAEIVWREGSLGLAESSLRRAVTLSPENAHAHFRLGLLLEQKGRYPEAAQSLARAKELFAKQGVAKPDELDKAIERVRKKLAHH